VAFIMNTDWRKLPHEEQMRQKIDRICFLQTTLQRFARRSRQLKFNGVNFTREGTSKITFPKLTRPMWIDESAPLTR